MRIWEKLFEPVTKSITDVSEDGTKILTETSAENDKALAILYNNFSEMMIDRSVLASSLVSRLSNVTNPEHTSQFKLVEDPNITRIKDLLIIRTIADTL